ncbi:P-loop containing nucleoside triphosphate hydrolase protein [Dissophora ornata]|nr:P-loop containing nucleoside triphosphate hydrolase protein [Dissophora ornata]
MYYIITIFASAINIRTMYDTGASYATHFIAFNVFFGLIILSFIIHTWPRERICTADSEGGTVLQERPSVYDSANPFSRVVFHFVQHVISVGYRRTVTNDDIANMMPLEAKTVHSHKRLSALWESHLQQIRRAESATEPSLLRVMLQMGGWTFLPIVIFMLLESTLEYAQPLLLSRLLAFMASYSGGAIDATQKPEPVALGIILSFALAGAATCSSLASGQFFQLGTNLGITLNTALISMIYKKALRLSPAARAQVTTGEIQNHMSVDAESIQTAITYLPLIISTPCEIAVGLYLLYAQLGLSALAGLGVVLVMTPMQGLLARTLNLGRNRKLEAMDSRIRVVAETMTGILAVKLNSWSGPFQERILKLRQTELKYLKRIGSVMAFMSIMATSVPTLMGLLSFIVFALVGGKDGSDGRGGGGGGGYLDARVVFVSMSLFGRLAVPIGRTSMILSQVITLRVATGRIQRFLMLEEVDIDFAQHRDLAVDCDEEVASEGDGPFAIQMQDCDLSWTRKALDNTASSPTLKNLCLQVAHGTLTTIVGRVGQGKSSLLCGIIGEMYKIQGCIAVSGSLAFVPQQAWILNGTLQDNILFGKPLDQERYDRIVFATGLEPDLQMLPARDQTEIGERGINLSGGQKQRVSLARAAYQDADIYLLDDPLSAVDAHIDQHLWQNLIGPQGLLKNKTRLLVTHSIHHLNEADQIVVVQKGEISESGSYQALIDAKSLFSQLMDEYSNGDKGNRITGVQENARYEELAALETNVLATAEHVRGDTATPADNEEPTTSGSGWKAFSTYSSAASFMYSVMSVALFIISQATQLGISVWLQQWTSRSFDYQDTHLGIFLGVYAAMVITFVALDVSVHYITFVAAGLKAATVFHNRLLSRILRLPMSFFYTTPTGRVLNRFSSDLNTLDILLPQSLSDFYFYTSTVLGTIIIISITLPLFAAFIPVLLFFYVLIQVYYIRTSRAMTHLHAASRSPLFQYFDETLAGLSCIHAMRQQNRFIQENAKRADKAANAYFATTVANRWLHMRLEFLGASVVLVTALLVVLKRNSQGFNGGNNGDSGGDGRAGLALNYALTATFAITFLVTSVTDFQNALVSVDRIQEYCQKPTEAPMESGADIEEKLLKEGWPSQGHVHFKNYSVRYREGTEMVLRNVSFEVQPGEHVGIVGRTGAGKSSITLALFRIIEGTGSYWERGTGIKSDEKGIAQMEAPMKDLGDGLGSIEIDGVDISALGLKTLRQHLSIIPQDPTLFAGTVRENLDPFHELEDAKLWKALERAHLKDHVSTLAGGLSFQVAQNGENFSVGQRSLICLARTLLRKTKILILDEATAAVDVETDELIQKTIRKEFKDRTILTIAHRIKTVMDSDKILVLEKGQVQEYGAPSDLLRRKESLFYKLAEQAGEI